MRPTNVGQMDLETTIGYGHNSVVYSVGQMLVFMQVGARGREGGREGGRRKNGRMAGRRQVGERESGRGMDS